MSRAEEEDPVPEDEEERSVTEAGIAGIGGGGPEEIEEAEEGNGEFGFETDRGW